MLSKVRREPNASSASAGVLLLNHGANDRAHGAAVLQGDLDFGPCDKTHGSDRRNVGLNLESLIVQQGDNWIADPGVITGNGMPDDHDGGIRRDNRRVLEGDIREIKVRAHLALGQLAEAATILEELPERPEELSWSLILRRAEQQLIENNVSAVLGFRFACRRRPRAKLNHTTDKRNLIL